MDDPAAITPELLETPATPDELHAWLVAHLNLTIPRTPLVAGHTAPFDYLAHAFFEPQEMTAAPPVRDSVVWANRGGGKTFLAAAATLLDLVFKPGIEVRVLGGSLDQSKRMHAHLRGFFEREAFASMLDGRIGEKRLRLTNGSVVELLAQSQTSVRGTRVQKLRCDEAELFHPEVWEAAQLTTRSAVLSGQLVHGAIECLSTMHRPYGLMRRLVGECQPGEDGREPARRLFKWGVVDALGACGEHHHCGVCPLRGECEGRAKQRDTRGEPVGHISVADAVRLKARVALPTWEAEMLCLRPRRTDCVLPEFDPRVHVVDALPAFGSGWTRLAGVDFGFRAPTVVLWAMLAPDGALFIERERSERETVLEDHARALAAEPRPTWVGIDPAGRQRSGQTGVSDAAVLRRAGLVVKDRRLPLARGIELLRARLKPASGSPRLFVHRRCRVLIKSLETYRYPEDRPESTEPVKDGSDHAVDALRYLVQNLDAGFVTSRGSYL